MPEQKTTRFADLLEVGGRPETHLSWASPASDPVLQRAAKQHRVVTIHQRTQGTRKDFGVVGLELGRDVQFLIFPKTLRQFAGRRVVGIRYDLLEGVAMAKAKTPKPAKIAKRARPARRGRVIEFPKPAEARVSRATETPPEEPTEPASDEEAREENDPTKAEVKKALLALEAGRLAEAKRRLRSLL